jgi:hypothetical protein
MTANEMCAPAALQAEDGEQQSYWGSVTLLGLVGGMVLLVVSMLM